MSKISLSLVFGLALALGLAASETQVSARSKGSPHGGTRTFQHNGHSYQTHYYHSSYRGWSSYCWFPHYRSYGYYCPTQCCWYYYYPQQYCYVPVQYISQLPPTVNQNTNQNTNQNVNVNTNIVNSNGGPALPVGATPLPVGGQQLPPGGVGPQNTAAVK